MSSDHLLIAIGMVTTGSDYEHDEIKEIAAKLVLPPCLDQEPFDSSLVFHSFVKTNQINIQKNRVEFHKEDAQNQRVDCATVLNDFLEWLQSVVREAKRNTDSYLITALVGHFALWKDFKFFLRYCENNSSSNIQDVIGLWCQFSDSGDLLCKLKKMNLWEHNVKTNLRSAYQHLLGENLPKEAGALEQAEALAKILDLPTFRPHLQYLDLLTYQGFKLWCEKDGNTIQFFDDLMSNFGPDLVYIELLHRMARKRISFQHVQNIYWASRNRSLFKIKVKKKHSLDLDSDEADELYNACKHISKSYNCCVYVANKIPKTSLKYK